MEIADWIELGYTYKESEKLVSKFAHEAAYEDMAHDHYYNLNQ